MWYKNITGRFFGLVKKHVCDGRNKAIADGNLCTRYVAPPGECTEHFDCLSHDATNVDNANANATRQKAQMWKDNVTHKTGNTPSLEHDRATVPEKIS